MPKTEDMFSPEYRTGAATPSEETQIEVDQSLEQQLEASIRDAVKRYGTGKPIREITRATIIHD